MWSVAVLSALGSLRKIYKTDSCFPHSCNERSSAQNMNCYLCFILTADFLLYMLLYLHNYFLLDYLWNGSVFFYYVNLYFFLLFLLGLSHN